MKTLLLVVALCLSLSCMTEAIRARAYRRARLGSMYRALRAEIMQSEGLAYLKGLASLENMMIMINAIVQAERRNQGYCANMTLPNAYGIGSCFNDVGRDPCNVSAADVSSLVMCAIDKIAAFGFNGYLFTNFYPIIDEIFERTFQNLTALDYLASYCLNGSHADEEFCQVDPSIQETTCGTPIEFQVPAPQPDESMCEPNEACQGVPPTDPTFGRLISDEFVCLVNLQPIMKNVVVYNDVACHLTQLLNQTDLTKYPVEDQLETVKSQLTAVSICPP
ncbi:uncharacterized protein ISCGN_021182 [Ixodes scapularis]